MDKINSYIIEIKGLVQGVGFRPFIYKIAQNLNLNGWIENRNNGVLIVLKCNKDVLNNFINHVEEKAPVASNIQNINISIDESITIKNTSFIIRESKVSSNEITQISPDIAVCKECLNDLRSQKHRINYPFINCTNCGPRFTIITDLPYDRPKTTMKEFPLCDICKSEYEDINDRRFHAQPVACQNCGPTYTIIDEEKPETDINKIINTISDDIHLGKIIAIKGLGGYNLVCDALNEFAVSQLRKRKNRNGKPFAVLFRDLEAINEYAYINEEEKKLLISWRRPIVLVEQKKELCNSVNTYINRIGAILPFMPLHYLLFEKLNTPAIILTSGNIADEPIVISNEEAESKFDTIADTIVSYNREIYNRADDSVLFVANNKPRIIRRSRGFVPDPIYLNHNVEGILAVGGELKNTFCIGKGNQAIISQHIGDIKNLETFEFFKESIDRFKKMFRFIPEIIVCDLHPDYMSTQYAKKTGIELIQVQHHHAHIASCMAENNIDEEVIGFSFDGTGYGDDGNIWGGEVFVCDLKGYKRVTQIEYIPLPGGDKAIQEPWRMAVSYLLDIYGTNFLRYKFDFLETFEKSKIEMLVRAIQNKINSPLSSGLGRVFDAVAALTNICNYNTFEAKAPMLLESIINESCTDKYPYNIKEGISLKSVFRGIIRDINNNIPNGIISAKFHNTIIQIILDNAFILRNSQGLNKVVLSGGTFQNKYLLEHAEKELIKNKFEVYSHSKIPSNDGGISLGQLVIAAKRR